MKRTFQNFKLLKIVTLLAAFLALAAILAGCVGAADTKVSFDGGSSFAVGSAPEGGSYRPGDVITLPECGLTREGYVFAGWSDGEKTYRAGDRYTVGTGEKEVEFTAVWAREILNIRFKNYDGALLWETTVKYGYGLSAGYPGADPTAPDSDLPGHRKVWDGWEPEIPEVFTEDTEFTAKFTDVPILYLIRYYDAAGGLYADFYENYGGVLKAPGKNPEKNVPEAEIHVERYEFAGWKKRGAPDNSAVLPDASGAIGTVSGAADFVPVFTAVKKIYTVLAPENPVGYAIRMSGGVTVGGTVKFVLTLEGAYSDSVPHASVAFGGVSKPVVLTPLADGGFEGSIENVEQNGTLSVTDVALNRYAATVNALNAEVIGLKADYAHGETASFCVVPNEHYRRSAPVVKQNGAALDPVVTEIDGMTRYEYSFVVTEGAEIFASGVADVYTVSVTDGYGSVTAAEKSAGEYFTFPSSFVKPSTDQFDYVFRDLTEKNGKLPDAYAGGAKIAVWDDYDYIVNFDEKTREYDVTIRVRGDETTVRQPYGKLFSEFLPAVDPTIVEAVSTHTFTGWFLKEAAGDMPLSADASVAKNAVVEAVYSSAPTLHDVTFTYLQGGTETASVVKVPYNTPFSEIEKPAPDDMTAAGKYFVWVSADGTELDGAFVTSALSATAVYRVFVFTVAFEDETGAARPEWTQAVEWGAAATAPTVPAEYETDTEVFTFTGWSEDLASVKSDLSVRPLYGRSTRYYAVTLRSETDASLTEVSGDRTFRSVYAFRLKLSENIDSANVKVFLKLGDAAAVDIKPEQDGIYRFTVTADATVYLEGVGMKKFLITLPVSETFVAAASDSTVVDYGGSFRFTVAKGAAYSRADLSVKANGTLILPNADGVYTVENIKKDVVVAIPDLPINVYAVTTEKGEGIAEITAPATAAHGSEIVWTVTLQAGYSQARLLYETAAADVSATRVDHVYTVTLRSAADDVSIRFYGEINQYRVTVAGTNFTSDVTEATVAHGGTFTVVLTLSERYNRNAPDVTGADARFEKIAAGVYRATVSGVTGDTNLIVTPKLNVYTVTVNASGVTVDGSAELFVRDGSTAEVRFFKTEGYTQNPPSAVLSDGTELIGTTDAEDTNRWVVTLPPATGDATLTVVSGAVNVYPVTLPGADAEAAGDFAVTGETSVRHGSDYVLTVTVGVSVNQNAPVVTLDDGTVLTDPVKTGDRYRYTIAAVKESRIVSVRTTVNQYAVSFVYPNGEKIEKQFTHFDAVTVPEGLETLQFNETAETADYVAGWTIDGKTVGYVLAGETAAGSVTYTAVKRTRYYTAKIGEKKYLFLESAIEEAVTGQAIEALKPGTNPSVELGGGKTIVFDRFGDKKEYELKSGVTFKLPYKDNLYSDFGDNDNRFNTAASQLGYADNDENLNLNLRVILPAGYTLNAHGEIQIGGVLSSQSQGRQGQTSSYYAELKVDGTLNVYGTLKTFGYVKGGGNVTSKSGAYVYQPFIVNDYKGGGHTSGTKDKVSPFNMFSLQNVQPGKYIIEYGAFEVGYAVLWTGKTSFTKAQYNRTEAYLVAPDTSESASVLKMGAGAYIENTFERLKNPKNETETITKMRLAGGTFIDGAMELKVKVFVTITVSTEKILLPISYLYNITVAKGATFTVANKYKLMPGASFEVEEGGVLNLNGSAIVYEKFDPTGSTLASYEYDQYYAGYASPASLVNNGAFHVNGSFGGLIGGTGSVSFDTNAVLSVTSDEYSKAGSSAQLTKFFTTTQTARGTVGGAATEFQPGNSYRLS